VKLRQEGKTIRQISIVLMMVLLIVFLVAAASAVSLESYSGPRSGYPGALAAPTSAVAPGSNSGASSSSKADGIVPPVFPGVPCKTKCTQNARSIDYSYQDTRNDPVVSFVWANVTHTLYLESTRKIEGGRNSRTCTPATWCSVNELCEQGSQYTETTGYWWKVGPLSKRYWWA
jgi:hypothetical protein